MTATGFHEGFLKTDRLTVYHARSSRMRGAASKFLILGGSNFHLALKTEFQRSAFVTRGDVVAYEPRGLGRTDSPAGSWTMSDYASDALSVLDALHWDQAIIIGESFGGMTALHLALMAPERVTALILSSATAGGGGGMSYDISKFLDLPPEDAAREALFILDNRNRALTADDPPSFAKSLASRMLFERTFLGSKSARDNYQKLLRARAAHDVWHRLNEIHHQTLLVSGEFDEQAPLSAQRKLAQSLPNGDHWVFPAGHGLLFSKNGISQKICDGWLTDQPIRAAIRMG